MPKTFIELQFLKQSKEYTCVPTFVRMVLNYYGDDRTETELEQLLGCTPFGTTAQSVMNVTRLGYQVDVRYSTLEELETFFDSQQPVIAFVWTGNLDYWTTNSPHAVVVLGYDEQFVYIADPYFDEAPQQARIKNFQAAWRRTRNRMAVIRRASLNGVSP